MIYVKIACSSTMREVVLFLFIYLKKYDMNH